MQPNSKIFSLNQKDTLNLAFNTAAYPILEKSKLGLTDLQTAARLGLVQFTIALIYAGASVDQTAAGSSESFKTPLILALESGQLLIAKILLALGADKEQALRSCLRLDLRKIYHLLASMRVDNTVIRALIFWNIRHYNSSYQTRLIDLIEATVLRPDSTSSSSSSSSSSKSSNADLKKQLSDDMAAFIFFAQQKNQMILLNRLIKLGMNIGSSLKNTGFSDPDRALTEYENFVISLQERNFIEVEKQLNNSKNNIFFLESLQRKNPMASCFLAINGNFAWLSFTNKLENESEQIILAEIHQQYVNLIPQLIAKSIKEANPTPHELKTLDFLMRGLNVNEKTNCLEIELRHQFVSVSEDLLKHRCDFYLDKHEGGTATVFDKIGKDAIGLMLRFLSKQDQVEFSKTCRKIRRIAIDPYGIKQRKLVQLTRRLDTVNQFLEKLAVEVDLIQKEKNFFRIKMILLSISMTVISFSGIATSAYFMHEANEERNDLKNSLTNILINNQTDTTCWDFIEDWRRNHSGCPTDLLSICEELCHSYTEISSTIPLHGLIFSVLIGAATIIPLLRSTKEVEKVESTHTLPESLFENFQKMTAENRADFEGYSQQDKIARIKEKAQTLQTQLQKQIQKVTADNSLQTEETSEKGSSNPLYEVNLLTSRSFATSKSSVDEIIVPRDADDGMTLPLLPRK